MVAQTTAVLVDRVVQLEIVAGRVTALETIFPSKRIAAADTGNANPTPRRQPCIPDLLVSVVILRALRRHDARLRPATDNHRRRHDRGERHEGRAPQKSGGERKARPRSRLVNSSKKRAISLAGGGVIRMNSLAYGRGRSARRYLMN
jgi:hypothetical protein